MPIQKYSCKRCGVESHIHFIAHADVMSVVHNIEDDHNKWSPECPNSYHDLKVYQFDPEYSESYKRE